jgi:hypothetical protein
MLCTSVCNTVSFVIFAAPDASLPEEDGVGNPSSAVAVTVPRLVPLAAGGSFMDISIYLMHRGLKSPHVISVLSQVLSCQKCMKASLRTVVLTWDAEGLLATLSVRLCLLRALDCSTHTRTNAN